ncbi:hypothetical protein DFH07DRAFT_770858 [Mycena maculata]|uniref:Uncharacterized protein n=1 Tax=Mycena maculata TaxID=230809 RepID=A0AAD7JED8_9AGAR|nr:hypothetical protein DFH07DRAFT_770858 [Mycena maculata]
MFKACSRSLVSKGQWARLGVRSLPRSPRIARIFLAIFLNFIRFPVTPAKDTEDRDGQSIDVWDPKERQRKKEGGYLVFGAVVTESKLNRDSMFNHAKKKKRRTRRHNDIYSTNVMLSAQAVVSITALGDGDTRSAYPHLLRQLYNSPSEPLAVSALAVLRMSPTAHHDIEAGGARLWPAVVALPNMFGSQRK